jgi:hypothetical protein
MTGTFFVVESIQSFEASGHMPVKRRQGVAAMRSQGRLPLRFYCV